MAELPNREKLSRMPVVYAPTQTQPVTIKRDIVYTVGAEQTMRLDIYVPDVAPANYTYPPAVLFVAGDRQMAQYCSWGALTAAHGLAAIVCDHREMADYSQAPLVANDLRQAVHYVQAHEGELGIDATRMAVWACSAHTPIGMCLPVREHMAAIRCLVSYYGPLNLTHLLDENDPAETVETLEAYSLVRYLNRPEYAIPPMLIVRPGKDRLRINEAVDYFIAEALRYNAPFELINYPDGRHAFDIVDDTSDSRVIIARTLMFLREHLLGVPA